MYVDPIINNHCKLNAINNFFGSHKINIEQYRIFCNNFDKMMKRRYNVDISCNDFDIFYNIISYILNNYGIYLDIIQIKQQNPLSLPDHFVYDSYFVFNENHIWCNKIVNNITYKLDGSINQITQLPERVGYMIPVNCKIEYYKQIKLIKSIYRNNIIDVLKLYLQLELPLLKCFNILEINYKDDSYFDIIKKNIIKYNLFLHNLTKDFNNKKLIDDNIHQLIKFLNC